MPSLENLHQRFNGRNFVLIGIDIQETDKTVLRTVRKFGLSYMNLLDSDGQVSALYGVGSTPAKILIDRDGNMTAAALGYREWDQKNFIELIEKMMD